MALLYRILSYQNKFYIKPKTPCNYTHDCLTKIGSFKKSIFIQPIRITKRQNKENGFSDPRSQFEILSNNIYRINLNKSIKTY